jgi:adhesin HecA-like repeat protein
LKKHFIFITARRKELRGGNMKKRRLMLCSIISLIMVFVMAVPMTVSADTATHVNNPADLQTAVNAGGEIVLDDDITASITIPKGKNITLDLNGKTLTNKAGNHTITNEGTLTIKGDGTVDNVSHAKAAVYNKQGATATLSGGKFTRSKETGKSDSVSGGNSYYNILNQGEMTINSGVEVSQTGHFSSLIDNGWYNGSENTAKINAKLTINGGTFSGGLNTIKNDDFGDLTIKDGKFSNTSGAVVLNWNIANISGGSFEVADSAKSVIANGYGNAEMDKGELTITGGTFTASNDGAGNIFGYTGSNGGFVKISGGTFDGDLNTTGYPYTPEISGGDFTDDPGQYVVNDKAVLVLDKDEYLVIYNDDDYACVLGATYKDVMRDTPYYYLDKEDAEQGELKPLGHSVDFYAMQPEGSIDYEQGDSITVPKGNSVKEFLAIVNKKYEFDKKAYAITDPKAVDGYKFLGWYNGKAEWNENDDTLASFAYGEKFDFDQKITKDTEVFAAWEKVGSGSNEPTQPGNLDKPSKDNGAVAKADKSAKTGDDFNLFAVGGVALAAIIAMAAVAITGRRHRQR